MGLPEDYLQILGSTQGNGNPYGPEIEIDGTMLADDPIFEISAHNSCTIEGLILKGAKYGIKIDGGNNNHIIGCYIGTDATGEVKAGNNTDGVYLVNSASNVIGGPSSGDRNVISGNNLNGIELDDSVLTQVLGNHIGSDRSGTVDLGNGQCGILMNNGSKQQYIASGNVIAYNQQDGVRINGNQSYENTLTQNHFFSNANKGISLLNGANGGIAFPNITTAEFYSNFELPGTLYVSGTGPANSTIELMKVASNETKAYGEGGNSAGFTLSDDSGEWFCYLATTEIRANDKICAAATDASGNTSEFSKDIITIGGTIVYRPDAMIGQQADGSDYAGEKVFNTNGFGQTKSKIMSSGETAIYYVKIKNSGNVSPDRMIITGTGSSTDWQIVYYDPKTGSNDVTSQITGAGLVTGTLASAETMEIKLAVSSIGKTVNTKEVYVTATSYINPSRIDVVKADTQAFFSSATDRYSFNINLPSVVDAGRPFTITLEAVNRNGQTTTEVSGNTQLSVDAGTINITSIESAQFADDGVWQGEAILSNVGDRTITVSNDYIASTYTAQTTVRIPPDIVSGGLIRFGPNPYNPASGQDAVFWYWLNEEQAISINVFDLEGRLIYKRVLVAGWEGGRTGINSIKWNGRNTFGEMLENGVYLVKIAQGNKALYSGKIIILK